VAKNGNRKKGSGKEGSSKGSGKEGSSKEEISSVRTISWGYPKGFADQVVVIGQSSVTGILGIPIFFSSFCTAQIHKAIKNRQ